MKWLFIWGAFMVSVVSTMGFSADSGVLQAEEKRIPVLVTSFAPGNQGAIHTLELDLKTGTLHVRGRTGDMEHPFYMALSDDRKFLYAIHAPGTFGGTANEFISAYEYNQSTGALTLINRESALGTAACYLDVVDSGKTVLVANYMTGSVASFPVRKDGGLEPAASFVQHEGSSINQDRQKEPHAHCFVVSPDNRFALAADLGIDRILVYQIDPETSQLSAAETPSVPTPAGSGPRHLVFHPNGTAVYVINELSNSVTHFLYDVKSGKLTQKGTVSTLPADFKETTHCADLRITPDGRFLYGTNRGHDSIAVFSIEPDGSLTHLNNVPSRGKGPQNLAITPDGHWLLCANMPGNSLAVFSIDSKTGRLTPTGTPFEVSGPSCILLP